LRTLHIVFGELSQYVLLVLREGDVLPSSLVVLRVRDCWSSAPLLSLTKLEVRDNGVLVYSMGWLQVENIGESCKGSESIACVWMIVVREGRVLPPCFVGLYISGGVLLPLTNLEVRCLCFHLLCAFKLQVLEMSLSTTSADVLLQLAASLAWNRSLVIDCRPESVICCLMHSVATVHRCWRCL
jgi:hypothetical protein